MNKRDWREKPPVNAAEFKRFYKVFKMINVEVPLWQYDGDLSGLIVEFQDFESKYVMPSIDFSDAEYGNIILNGYTEKTPEDIQKDKEKRERSAAQKAEADSIRKAIAVEQAKKAMELYPDEFK